jgi:hypothetical protein
MLCLNSCDAYKYKITFPSQADENVDKKLSSRQKKRLKNREVKRSTKLEEIAVKKKKKELLVASKQEEEEDSEAEDDDSEAEDEGLGEEESDTDDVKGFTDENAAWLRPSGQKRKLPLGEGSDDDEDEEKEDEDDSDDDDDEKDSDDDDYEKDSDEEEDEEMGVEKQARLLEKKQKKMLKESDAELRMNLAETEKFTLPSGKWKAVLWIRIGFNADPDPGSQTSADPGIRMLDTKVYFYIKMIFKEALGQETYQRMYKSIFERQETRFVC